MALELWKIYWNLSFPHFFSKCLQILSWFLVCESTMVSFRSSIHYVLLCWFFQSCQLSVLCTIPKFKFYMFFSKDLRYWFVDKSINCYLKPNLSNYLCIKLCKSASVKWIWTSSLSLSISLFLLKIKVISSIQSRQSGCLWVRIICESWMTCLSAGYLLMWASTVKTRLST